jgi:hypothetical protein
MSAPQIITIQQARSTGLRRYYTGKPCLRGHLSERYVIKSFCIDCKRENNNVTWLARSPTKRAPAGQIVSREAARIRGLTLYYTGEPCRHGHVSDRYTRKGCCTECARICRSKRDAR